MNPLRTELEALKVPQTILEGNLERGVCYLLKDESPRRLFEIFSHLSEFYKTLLISRVYPEKLEREFEFHSKMCWLSNVENGESIDPNQLDKLGWIILDFMQKNQNSLILLDGIEYLISENDFLSVLKMIHYLRDYAVLNNAILFIPISPKTLKERELKLLERETASFEW
ncbi:MAG: DUF835 domain-containing protein [Candidatus Methanofastidiosia archaeon]